MPRMVSKSLKDQLGVRDAVRVDTILGGATSVDLLSVGMSYAGGLTPIQSNLRENRAIRRIFL